MYSNTCVKCEEGGVKSQYFGGSSTSLYERAGQHLYDAVKSKTRSHIHQHMTKVHPEISIEEYHALSRFEVVQGHTTAFRRQLHEVVRMKKAPCIILNLKDEYTRCCIPDVQEMARRQ